MEHLKKISIVDTEVQIGDEKLITIKGDVESVQFDEHEIVNNDDGWLDGFELSWREIWEYCKAGVEADLRKESLKRLKEASE